jgi:predicted transcriptional regulator
MDSNEALHELARRARVERSLYIAEAISGAIFAVHQFIRRQVAGPDAGRKLIAKPLRRIPAHQR